MYGKTMYQSLKLDNTHLHKRETNATATVYLFPLRSQAVYKTHRGFFFLSLLPCSWHRRQTVNVLCKKKRCCTSFNSLLWVFWQPYTCTPDNTSPLQPYTNSKLISWAFHLPWHTFSTREIQHSRILSLQKISSINAEKMVPVGCFGKCTADASGRIYFSQDDKTSRRIRGPWRPNSTLFNLKQQALVTIQLHYSHEKPL